MALVSLVWIFLLQCCTTITLRCNAHNLTRLPIPALFFFGDSEVDTGNNNYINSIFKANYTPYGMSFPGRVPTGRFSDGKLVPDILASMIGVKEFLPPFLQPNIPDHELPTGVCFASAGSGLDDETTAISHSIPVSKQPEYFIDYIERLKRIVGRKEAQRLINEALVSINTGNVDFIYNFYLLRSRRWLQFNVSQYQDLLLNNLQNLLKKLYKLGCRKMTVSGLAPLGCLPIIMTANSPLLRTCIEYMNSDAQAYNEKLVKLLQQVEANLPGSKFVYADIYNPVIDMIKNPNKYGFVETARGCCGTGLLEVGHFCNLLTPLCSNPSQYLFFDSIHPSQAAYRYLTEHLVKELLPIIVPK